MKAYTISDVTKMTGIPRSVIYEYVKRLRPHFPGLSRGRCNSLVFTQKDVEFILEIRQKNKVESATMDEILDQMRYGEYEGKKWEKFLDMAELLAVRLSEQDSSLSTLIDENKKLKNEISTIKATLSSRSEEDEIMRRQISMLFEDTFKDRREVSFARDLVRRLTDFFRPDSIQAEA